MTNNNEIYVDGVNVAGCEHYREGFCYRGNFGGGVVWKCNDKTEKNCMFKQLQKEKQKNEELEKVLKQIRQIRFDTVYYADSEDEIILLINKILGDMPNYD